MRTLYTSKVKRNGGRINERTNGLTRGLTKEGTIASTNGHEIERTNISNLRSRFTLCHYERYLRTVEQIHKRTNEWTDDRMNERTNGLTNDQAGDLTVEEQTDKRTNATMVERTNGRTDGRTGE